MTTRPQWFRLDCDIPDDPAFSYLREQGNDSAITLHIWAMAYCARRLTDGFVPYLLPRQWGFKPRDAEALINLGMWKEYEEPGLSHGYFIVGYLDQQPSREQWERFMSRQRNAALARWARKP
jgi:hypothetical protein